mgnify:CR=1 FL=1
MKRLQHLTVELSKKTFFVSAKIAPQACFGASTIELGRSNLKTLEAALAKVLRATTTH